MRPGSDGPVFQWAHELGELRGYYRVEVYGVDDEEGGPALLHKNRIKKPKWTPDANERTLIPEHFRWRVIVFIDGSEVAAASALGSR